MPRKPEAPRALDLTRQSLLGPSAHVGDALQVAFDFFNTRLFDSRLPRAMILLHRKKNANGYFWPERFGHRHDGEITSLHEIALRPNTPARRAR